MIIAAATATALPRLLAGGAGPAGGGGLARQRAPALQRGGAAGQPLLQSGDRCRHGGVCPEWRQWWHPSFNEARAEFEKEYLIRLLRTTEGNVTLAANMAGRNRTDFYKLLNRHGIEAANFKSKG